MQTLATRPVPPRPAYPQSSHIVVNGDGRIRQLAAAMVRLNADGGCTERLLIQEGFSRHEIAEYGDAARAMADGIFVRQIADEAASAPLKTDDELLVIALDRCGGLINESLIVSQLRNADFTPDTIARLWPRITRKLGERIARLPVEANR